MRGSVRRSKWQDQGLQNNIGDPEHCQLKGGSAWEEREGKPKWKSRGKEYA